MRSLIVIAGLCVSAATLTAETAPERLRTSTQIFNEIMATPDKSIPTDLLEKAECVVIVPSMKKGAFIIGGQYGKGFVSCRRTGGRGWGAPAAIRIEGGSVGFQIGGQSADLVMLVMNRRGMEQLTKSKFTLGGDASVAAGPVGRTTSAQTDAFMTAEILSWSRTKGVFAGISLNGATLRSDEDVNKELYGRKLPTQDIILTNIKPPTAAAGLIAALDRYSMRKEGSADRQR
jgi:SH3 domain-containing YSC84-like protein 1